MNGTQLAALCTIIAGCGARSGLDLPDGSSPDAFIIVDAAGSDSFVPADAPDAFVIRDTGMDVSDVGTDTGVFACAPNPVSPGDLVKASGPAVYYIARDCRRYVFVNENTYYSWYPDFTGVRTITDTQLAAIMIGGNVTMRPGTWMVKFTSDPRTYAVTRCGELHWVESEADASALYGPMWNRHIRDLPDAFGPNYTIGASSSGSVHPDGTLITYAGSSDVYVMDAGTRRRFAPGAFEANGFQREDSRDPTVPYVTETTIVYPDGPPVTGREPDLAEVIPPSCLH